MFNIIKKLFHFIKRDYFEAISYKFDFIFSLFKILFSSATMFFIANLFLGKNIPSLSQYGGNYFPFVLIGMAFSELEIVFENNLPNTIRNAQTTGTLEALFMTRTSMPAILLGLSLYPLLWTCAEISLYFIFGIFLFGVSFSHINLIACLIVIILGSIGFISIGIFAASFVIIFKMGNPFSWALGSVSGLLGGIFFPVESLPHWLKIIAYLLPITHTLEGLRKSMLTASSLSNVFPSIVTH